MLSNNNLLFFGIIIALGIIVVYVFTGTQKDQSYENSVQEYRERSVDNMLAADNSPFNEEHPFEGLNYYPINRDYKVQADITFLQDYMPLYVKTTEGSTQEFVKYARLTFTLFGEPDTLIWLQSKTNPEEKLLAFTDETSGDSSYAAGRYLPLEYKTGSQVTLDFNLAFNPYCAYNESFICPMPPRKNHIDVPIKAGEKVYHHDH